MSRRLNASAKRIQFGSRRSQARRPPLEFIEPRQRGVQVCLVEYLASFDRVAVDSQKLDHSPLGVEAFCARSHASYR